MGKKNYKYEARIKPDWRKVESAAQPPLIENNNAKVRLSFEHVSTGDALCLSLAGRDDVRHAMECLRKMTSMTWMQVYQTATKDPAKKSGIHWNPYEDAAITVNRPAHVSDEHKITGIRAGDKYRIFGFRFKAYFYVLWFDPEHTVCPA